MRDVRRALRMLAELEPGELPVLSVYLDMRPHATGGAPAVRTGTVMLRNRLRRIEFAAPSNGVIDGFGRVGEAGAFIVDLAEQPTAVTFTVRRVDPAQATTASFVVTDGCGPWPTFVVVGPGSF